MIGYEDYKSRLSNLAAGIAANDYIISPASSDFPALIRSCEAREVFRNKTYLIHHIPEACRSVLVRKESLESATRFLFEHAGDPAKMPDPVLLQYVIAKPQQIGYLRARLESNHWRDGRCLEAVKLLDTVIEHRPDIAEAHYSLAFSLQCAGNPLRAVQEYTISLDQGYSEFWVRYHRGMIHFQRDDLRNARLDIVRADHLNPGHPGVREILKQLELRKSP
jgi:hypothetical protein